MDQTPPAPRPPLDIRDIRGVDLLLVVGIGLAALVAVDMAIAVPAPSMELVLGLLVLQNAVLIGAVYLVAVRLRGVGWRALGLVPAGRRWYVSAAVMGVLAFALVGVINWIVQTLTGEPFQNPQLRVIAPAGFSWSGFIGMTVMVGAVAPFAEELAFRGLLYGWLRRRLGVTAGAVGSALVFSVVHGIPALIPAIAALGVILALVYERSGSLWPAMVLHGAHNVVNVLLLYASLAYDIPIR